jgi:NifB/MoaA-like Fe-S oxidoreductase
MEQLLFLARHGIRFHTQIVVCPTVNDGKNLERSVGDLLTLGDSLRSIAVVPVGLTRFRTVALPSVDHRVAVDVCRSVARLSDRAACHDGFRKVFIADEFYIKAKAPIPEAAYYEDYPQIENGVGLIRQLMDSWQQVKKSPRRRKGRRGGGLRKHSLMVTSVSAYPYLAVIIDELMNIRPDLAIKVVPVINRFFGETVTVAGLLTASDIIRQTRRVLKTTAAEEVIVPSVIVNHAGFTLDGYSLGRLAREIDVPVRVVNSIGELVY